MDELRVLLQENLNTEFLSAVLSNPRIKDGTEKVKVRPLLKKGTLFLIHLLLIQGRNLLCAKIKLLLPIEV